MVKDEENILTIIEQAGLLDYLLQFTDVTKQNSYQSFIEGRRYVLTFDEKADIRPIIESERLLIRSFERRTKNGTLIVELAVIAEPQMLEPNNFNNKPVKNTYLSDLEGMNTYKSW